MDYAPNTNKNASIFGGKVTFNHKDFSWMSHDLQFWNLVITTGGQCRLSNQFGELRAETGDVLLSPPSKNRFFSVNGAWECIWFGFNLHTHVNWNQPVREIYHVHPGEETFTRIRNDAEEAYALLAEESGNVFPLVENLLENILMRGNAESLFELNPRLEAAKNFIAANLRINDFKEVARRFGMSRTKFFQTFRETYGTTPQKYHEKIKFQNVCSLLATTDLSFSEIAKICGFSSLFYLSKRFRALFKTSMRSYRAQSSGKTLL